MSTTVRFDRRYIIQMHEVTRGSSIFYNKCYSVRGKSKGILRFKRHRLVPGIIGGMVGYLPYVRLVLTEISPGSSGEAREEEVYVGSHVLLPFPFTLGTTPATPGASRTGSSPVLSLSPGCRASTNRTGLDPALNTLSFFFSLSISPGASPGQT